MAAGNPDDVSPSAKPSSSSVQSPKPAVSSGTSSGTSSGISPIISPGPSNNTAAAPPGHAFRRARTVNDVVPSRRRPSTTRSEASFDGLPRRSSNFSEYSFGEARDILYPQARTGNGAETQSPEASSLASLSLAFALLPALAGVLFQNGNTVVTDVMLLGLAGVFLHWSVTQPWVWYHDAQQVRVQNEPDTEAIVDDETNFESPPASPKGGGILDDVPEEDDSAIKVSAKNDNSRHRAHGAEKTRQQQAALGELYLYEVLALFSCFVLPLISAYLLHAIRSQLSRPSEGLVSNYNLTIFLLVSELRVFSHVIKLVKSRTLHLQRIVHGDPFGSSAVSGLQMEDVLERLERLESMPRPDDMPSTEQSDAAESVKAQHDALVARNVRNAIQPELDALNRAVRRYEKKATLLQLQTDSRFVSVDARLDDAIALAAAAAKNSSSNKNLLKWTADAIISIIILPFNAILQILVLPLRGLLILFGRNKQGTYTATKPATRNGRAGKAPAQGRYANDRGPTGRASRR